LTERDTYNRHIQLGAARQRYQDSRALLEKKRWKGAMYLGGYTIECSLKSLICYIEHRNSFQDTKMFCRGEQGATLHNLNRLLRESSQLERFIATDRTGQYKNAWNTIANVWQHDILRYSDKPGDEEECNRFLDAVKLLYKQIMSRQGEAS